MKVQEGQSVLDICMQELGDLEKIWTEVIIPNGLTINSNLGGNLDLRINAVGKGNERIKDYYSINSIMLNNRSLENEFITETFFAIQWPVYVDLLEPININKRIQV